MTLEEWMKLLAPLSPLLVAAIALAVLKINNLRKEAKIQSLDLDEKLAAKVKRVATGAVLYAEEAGEAGKRAGSIAVIDKAKLAGDLVAEEFEDMDPDDVTVAVQTAVSELPGVGATGKKNGAHS